MPTLSSNENLHSVIVTKQNDEMCSTPASRSSSKKKDSQVIQIKSGKMPSKRGLGFRKELNKPQSEPKHKTWNMREDEKGRGLFRIVRKT